LAAHRALVLRTASPSQLAAFYANDHPQPIADQALSLAWLQKSAQKGQEQKIGKKLKMQQRYTASDICEKKLTRDQNIKRKELH